MTAGKSPALSDSTPTLGFPAAHAGGAGDHGIDDAEHSHSREEVLEVVEGTAKVPGVVAGIDEAEAEEGSHSEVGQGKVMLK